MNLNPTGEIFNAVTTAWVCSRGTYYYSHGVEVQQDVFSSGTFMTRRHEDLASAVLCSAAYC